MLTPTFSLSALVLAAAARLNAVATPEPRRPEAIEDSAHLDPLTGLSNRARFLQRLEEAVGRGRCALLLLDLDRFRAINGSLGRAAGDALLIEVAKRMRPLTRNAANLGRLGGDKFALILEEGDAERFTAQMLVCRLQAALGKPVTHRGSQVWLSGSVALAFARPGETATADLLEAADLDMYRKKSGRRHRAAA